MKQQLLQKKFRTNSRYPQLEQDIQASIDLGSYLSIGPTYTYYYSRSTSYQYIKNSQLTRIYTEIIPGRYGRQFIILELKNNRKIKFSGIADPLKIRNACDKFCPDVIFGALGKEMTTEELILYYQKRKKYMIIFFSSLFLWSLIFFYCCSFPSVTNLIFLAVASIAETFVCIRLILWLKKYWK